MASRALRCWTAAAAAAVAIAGCGQTAENGPSDKARTTVATFLDACAHEHPVAAADILTEDARARFVESGATVEACAGILNLAGGTPPPDERELTLRLSEATVDRAEANGGFASVTVSAPEGLRSTVELESVRGRWYLSNPLP